MRRHKWVEASDAGDEAKCAACGLRRRVQFSEERGYPMSRFSHDGSTWYSARPDCGDAPDPSTATNDEAPARKRSPGKTVHGNAILDVRMRKPGSEYYFTAGIAFVDNRNGGIKVKLWACPVGAWDGEMWIFPQEGNED